MSAIAIELVIILLLLFVNGGLAMSELALVSARRARLQSRAEAGDRGARAALRLAEEPTRFLSTVQIGITSVGILAGAFGGATLAATLERWLSAQGLGPTASGALSVGLVVLAITYLSLIVGELVPKRLAMRNPEGVAARVARPMQMLATLAAPAVTVLAFSTDIVLRLLGRRQTSEPPVTEDEVRIILQQGTEAGVFEAGEQEIVSRVFRFADRRVGELMTPRPNVIWLDPDDSPALIEQEIANTHHLQFPVCRGDLDTVVGVLSIKDLWAAQVTGRPLDLQEIVRPAEFFPDTMPMLQALEAFKRSRAHMALVVDEFGGTAGVITLNDVLEALVGDIPVTGQVDESPFVRRDDGSWLVDGLASIDDVKETLGLRRLPDETAYQTLGGLVMAQLGRIPRASDAFVLERLRFEVVDMDGNRVDKVLIALAPDGSSETTPTPVQEGTR